MKTILVLTGGGETDEVVFDTALAVARPLDAHLEFLHVRIGAAEAAAFTPHVDFASGAALRNALSQLEDEAGMRSAAAARDIRRFCEREAIEFMDLPSRIPGLSASWREEREDAVERMMRHARHNDLVVVGRSSRSNGLPRTITEQLLVGSGRPIVIAPPRMRPNVQNADRGSTVLVCWKESATSARALGAAMPILSKSRRVVVVGIEESGSTAPEAIGDLVRQLAWHGIPAEFESVPADGRSVAEQMESAAIRYDADLLVMGGYGHGRIRETVFGGCTQAFLDYAGLPVLMMH
jgi:nucleotide-binding universal stress UspA family protein